MEHLLKEHKRQNEDKILEMKQKIVQIVDRMKKICTQEVKLLKTEIQNLKREVSEGSKLEEFEEISESILNISR